MRPAAQILQVKNTFLQVSDLDCQCSVLRRQMSDPLMRRSSTFCDGLKGAKHEWSNTAIKKNIERTQIPSASSIEKAYVEAAEIQESSHHSRASVQYTAGLADVKVAIKDVDNQLSFESDSAANPICKGSLVPEMPTDLFMRQMSTLAKFANTRPMSGLKGEEVGGSKLFGSVAKIFTVFGLPRHYTEDLLVQELADGGFRYTRDYSFLDVPRTLFGEALGYFFIGFEQSGVGNAFKAAYEGRFLHSVSHCMALVVRYATPEDVKYARLAASGATSLKMGNDPQNAQQQHQHVHGFCRFCGNMFQTKNPHRPFKFCPQCGTENQPSM